MSDSAKFLADNQKEMLKLIAPMAKKPSEHQALENSDSEPGNSTVARTSTPVKTKATTSKATPINSRYKTLHFSVPTKPIFWTKQLHINQLGENLYKI